MELILNEEDIKKVLEEHYSGVKGVTFDISKESVKAIIEIEADFLRRKSYSVVTPVETETATVEHRKLLPITLEEKNKGEAKKGVMASGGRLRTIKSMG